MLVKASPPDTTHLLGHLLLLLFPLICLQVEQSIDLLFFGLRIIQLHHAAVDGMARVGNRAARRRLIAGAHAARVDRHLARHVAGRAAFPGASCGQPPRNDGCRTRYDSGVIVVFCTC
jgi:membrane protein required for beta-lactamase induction